MTLSQRYFATLYDSLHVKVEGRLVAYRQLTAGRAIGDVLEIGAGSGANLPYYTGVKRLTLIEPNPFMSKRLRHRLTNFPLEATIFEEAGEVLPFPEASFDSVVTTLVLCMVEDLETVLSEVRRVLKCGGSFFFYEHVGSEGWMRRRLERVVNPAWRFLTTGCNLNRDIAGAIRKAGFAEVEVNAFDLSVGIPWTLPNIVGVAKGRSANSPRST